MGRLAELDRLASPAPWLWEELDDGTPIVFVPGKHALRLATVHPASLWPRVYKRVTKMRGPIAIPEAWANAELIALMRNALGELLEALP